MVTNKSGVQALRSTPSTGKGADLGFRVRACEYRDRSHE